MPARVVSVAGECGLHALEQAAVEVETPLALQSSEDVATASTAPVSGPVGRTCEQACDIDLVAGVYFVLVCDLVRVQVLQRLYLLHKAERRHDWCRERSSGVNAFNRSLHVCTPHSTAPPPLRRLRTEWPRVAQPRATSCSTACSPLSRRPSRAIALRRRSSQIARGLDRLGELKAHGYHMDSVKVRRALRCCRCRR